MKNACRSFAGGQLPQTLTQSLPKHFSIVPPLQQIARTFVELQEQRHKADYDLSLNFNRHEVLAMVYQSEQAINDFDQLPPSELKNFFLSCLIMWKTLTNRS